MSDDFEKRKTKKDKARRNKEYNGKYTPKTRETARNIDGTKTTIGKSREQTKY